jgi:DNA-binding LacI/PurR family transcriptional regulator
MRRVTIKSVARRAGVTTTTVSRALNDKPDISPATKARILAIAEAIGYVPSSLARSLATQRSQTVGLAVRTIADMWVAEVVPAIEVGLREAGYSVFLSSHYANEERERLAVEAFQSRQVDGIIVISSVLQDEYLSLQREWRIPIVLISPLMDRTHPYIVTSDDEAGAALATEHLISLGHSRLGYIGVPRWVLRAQSRLDGYRRTLAANNIPYDASLVVLGDAHQEGGFQGIRKLLSLSNPPTAVVCFNDLTAIGVLRGARAAGVRVPQDLSIMGFDDVPMTEYVDPPISTIRQDAYGLGEHALSMLLDLMSDRRSPKTEVVLPTELVVRNSTDRP